MTFDIFLSARKTFISAFFLFPAISQADWLCEKYDLCSNGSGAGGGRSSSYPAQPTANSSISLNPSAVPTQKTLGIETIYYQSSFDFAFVKGIGRVGAAISPTNTEETFFGAPGFERDDIWAERKRDQKKLKSQKVALATAFNIYDNRRSGLKKFELNLGLAGKYNKVSYRTSPGGGISGVAGPFTFGYSTYKDSFVSDEELYAVDLKAELEYQVDVASIGVFLSNVAFDYSQMKVHNDEFDDIATISVMTASLLLKKAIITVSYRKEDSLLPKYNYSKNEVTWDKEGSEIFGGVQFVVHKNILIGAFYNYYLLHEASIGLTAFF